MFFSNHEGFGLLIAGLTHLPFNSGNYLIRWNNALINVLLVLTSIAVVFVILEAGLRVAGYSPRVLNPVTPCSTGLLAGASRPFPQPFVRPWRRNGIRSSLPSLPGSSVEIRDLHQVLLKAYSRLSTMQEHLVAQPLYPGAQPTTVTAIIT